MPRRAGSPVAAGALMVGALALLVPAGAFAQGKSNQPHGHPSPPSSSPLPVPSATAPGIGAMPLAWVDDANLMESGAMAIDLSITRWQGNGIGETDAPVVNVAVGVTDRFQFAASIPRIVGNETSGVAGGLGTTYFTLKYAAYANQRLGLKVAVAPTLEVLGTGVLPSLGPDETRAQFGVPVSMELDRDGRRFYASSGWFSRGVWFAGAGAGTQIAPRIGASASFSRSWTTAPIEASGLPRNRTELSGGLSFAVKPHVSVFASLGHTIATTAENGAGATVGGGVSLYLSPAAAAPRKPAK